MIDINNINKSIGGKSLLQIGQLKLGGKEKVGLIGDNGVGKTTLLRILSGLDKEYTGIINVSIDIQYRVDEMEQKDYSKARLKEGDHYSPGELQRLKLNHLLENENSFLLMDEPTSHLDIHQIEKLMEGLNNRKFGFLMISHDRNFINQTCNKIIEIVNGKIEVYNGNYSFYLEEKMKRTKFLQKEYKKYVDEKKRLENLASNIQEKSSKLKTAPKRMGNSEARLHKMGGQENKKKLDKQAKAVRTRIEKLETREKPVKELSILLTAPENKRIYSKILMQAEDLNKAYGEKVLFNHAKFEIRNSTKTALIGENGSGKTTLLKMVLRQEDIWVHPHLRIGYYSQMEEILRLEKSVLENIIESSIYDQSMTRIILARLGFKTEAVHKTVGVLSDGERAKVKLAKILTSNYNFLVFDEPTNYLDIRAIEALEDLLSGYDRPLLFVTHDVHFINKIADNLLIIKDKKLISFKGNLEEYKNRSKPGKDLQDEMMLDFKLSTLNSRLTMDLSKEEREVLEKEYYELLKLKK